jgi:repressor LexA
LIGFIHIETDQKVSYYIIKGVLRMNKSNITDRQKEILEYIYEHLKNEGFPPAFADFKEKFNIKSNQAIIDHLDRLEEKNLIVREERSARGINIRPAGFQVLDVKPLVPFVGQSSAGLMVEAQEIEGDWKSISSGVDKFNGEVYLIRVKGDSMINAGIDDSDILLVQPATEFSSGDIVLVETEGETTVKRFVREDKPPYMYLKPENPKYDKILFTPETNITMKGKIKYKLEAGKAKPISQGSFV